MSMQAEVLSSINSEHTLTSAAQRTDDDYCSLVSSKLTPPCLSSPRDDASADPTNSAAAGSTPHLGLSCTPLWERCGSRRPPAHCMEDDYAVP